MKRTYSFWKRAVAVLTSTALAVTMCVPALAWGSSNGAAESAQIITCNVSVKAKNFGNGEASSATTLSGVTLNDGWLTATNTAAYNGQLATWASVVATAAYKDDTTVTVTSRTIGSGTSTAAPAKGHSWGAWTTIVAAAKKSDELTVPRSLKVANKRYAVRGIEPKAFAGTKATKLVIEAKGLSKKSLRNCLKGSKIQRVVVRAYKSTKKNEDYALLLKKYLTKAVCGKTVKVVAA